MQKKINTASQLFDLFTSVFWREDVLPCQSIANVIDPVWADKAYFNFLCLLNYDCKPITETDILLVRLHNINSSAVNSN